MTHISEHDTKQEGERNNGKYSRVYLFVHWNTIGVDNLLESKSKFIAFNIGRRLNSMVAESLEVSGRIVLKDFSDLTFVCNRAPEESNICTSSWLHIV